MVNGVDDPEEIIPTDQKEFIASLINSFEKYSDQSNEYFPDTLSFLSENCFLGPLVCSLRAIMSQGFGSFPEFIQYKRGNYFLKFYQNLRKFQFE